MHVPSEKNPAATLRAACAAALLYLSACGGSDDGAPSPASASTPPPRPAGTATAVDGGTSGRPVSLRVARSANGDGFVVWRADDGTRHNLWASRYRAATGAWGDPVNVETSSTDIDDDFDVTVDAQGNAVVAWTELNQSSGQVTSARFDSGAGAWAAPVVLGRTERSDRSLRVAGDATGAVQVVYGYGAGRFFDPASGVWQPEARIAQTTMGSGHSYGPVPSTDGSGNALVVFHYGRTSAELLGSNYFSRSSGSWDQLPPDAVEAIIGEVPGSVFFGIIYNVQLAASADGNFVAAWHVTEQSEPGNSDIRGARFTSATRTWSLAQPLVTRNARQELEFQRIGSDADGNALVLWTEREGMRTALKSFRLDDAGAVCGGVQTVDRAIGGGAAHADLAVDRLGHAIVVWQQFEGGRPGDGSRSNIAISHFDRATGAWEPAALAEMEPGNATGPRASASGGHWLLGWIQSEGGADRVKVMLQSLPNAPRP
jgi:hypothetical protein